MASQIRKCEENHQDSPARLRDSSKSGAPLDAIHHWDLPARESINHGEEPREKDNPSVCCRTHVLRGARIHGRVSRVRLQFASSGAEHRDRAKPEAVAVRDVFVHAHECHPSLISEVSVERGAVGDLPFAVSHRTRMATSGEA